ncbi:hypothetical protein CDIK_3686, partial [Cucumispora dikerogammari]
FPFFLVANSETFTHLETEISFQTPSFIDDYKISEYEIIKYFKILYVNNNKQFDQQSTSIPCSSFTEATLADMKFFKIKCKRVKKKNSFIFTLHLRKRKSSLFQQTQKLPSTLFKLCFIFPGPVHEYTNNIIIGIVKEVKNNTQNFENLAGNQIRETIVAVNQALDLAKCLILTKKKKEFDNIYKKISEQRRSVFFLKNISLKLKIKTMKYFDILKDQVSMTERYGYFYCKKHRIIDQIYYNRLKILELNEQKTNYLEYNSEGDMSFNILEKKIKVLDEVTNYLEKKVKALKLEEQQLDIDIYIIKYKIERLDKVKETFHFKIVKEIKKSLMSIIQKEVDKSKISTYQKLLTLKVFTKVINDYSRNELYFLSDILAEIKARTREAASFLILETQLLIANKVFF